MLDDDKQPFRLFFLDLRQSSLVEALGNARETGEVSNRSYRTLTLPNPS